LPICLAISTIVLILVFLEQTADITTENLTAAIENGGSINNVYYCCCAVCLFLIATGRANRNFTKETDASSLDLLYLTGLRSLDIILGKWIALALQGLLIMVALFPFALIGYFMSGADIPTTILKSVGLYTLFLIIISITLADTAQAGGKTKGGKIGFTTGFIAYSLLSSTQLVSLIGTSSIYDLIIDQLNSPLGFLQTVLVIVAVAMGIRLTLHRGAASIAPPFEKTVLVRRLEVVVFGAVLCFISIGTGFTLLATSGLLIYFAYVGAITAVNLAIETQQKIIIDQDGSSAGVIMSLFKTEGWRGGIFIVIYMCAVLSIITVLSGLEPWRAMCIGSVITGSILVSRFYFMLIEKKREVKFWDFFWFQVALNVIGGLISNPKIMSWAPIGVIIHIVQPSTTFSGDIILAVSISLLSTLAVIALALFSPVEYEGNPQINQIEPTLPNETTIND
jgi:hypothetical protein